VQTAGVVANEKDLLSADELRADVLAIDPITAIGSIPPRRLLIGHGTDDIEVPASDARDLVAGADGRPSFASSKVRAINCGPIHGWWRRS